MSQSRAEGCGIEIMVYEKYGTIKYEVGDWVYVLSDGWNDSGNKEYKRENPSAMEGDVLKIMKFVPQSDGDKFRCAVCDEGQVIYIDKYKEQFRPATEKEIKSRRKTIMVGVYPVVFNRGIDKIETINISVGCVTVGKSLFYEIGREANWLP